MVSKIAQTHHAWNGDDSRCHEMLEQALTDLRVEYLDLLLIHWFASRVQRCVFPNLSKATQRPLPGATGRLHLGKRCLKNRQVFRIHSDFPMDLRIQSGQLSVNASTFKRVNASRSADINRLNMNM